MKIIVIVPTISLQPAWYWTYLAPFGDWCANHAIDMVVKMQGDKQNIACVREHMICGGAPQASDWSITKPWNGQVPYDRILWIDSDVAFTPGDFQKLLDDDLDIVSGLYPLVQEEKTDGSFVLTTSAAGFNGKTLDPGGTGLQEVSWTASGFLFVKSGVYEAIPRPWYETGKKELAFKPMYCGEDIAFCLNAKEAGFKVFVDWDVLLGHRKESYLRIPRAKP